MIAIDPSSATRSSATRQSAAGSDLGAFRAAFADARQRGASALAGGLAGAAPSGASESEQEFLDYASMSLQDKMFYAALASLGISKKDYDAMSAADKLKIADKVALALRQLAEAEQAKQAERDGRAV